MWGTSSGVFNFPVLEREAPIKKVFKAHGRKWDIIAGEGWSNFNYVQV